MKVSRSLHLTAFATCVFAIVILAIGERSPLLAIPAAIFCGTGVILKEVYGKHLGTFWGNLAAMAALVVAIWSFDIERTELRLIAMANLLVYAQFVLFFRERNPHAYWMMLLLSLLQVCVASVLINDYWLAILLLGYMLLATRMIILLTYRRECYDAVASRRRNIKTQGTANTKTPSEGLSAEKLLTPRARGLRWTMAGQPASFAPRLSRKSERKEYGGYQWHWVRLCLLTILFVPILFAGLPRHNAKGGFVAADIGGLNSVGFSTEVTLGELGISLESTEEVMRVSFTDPRSGAPIQLRDGQAPLLRGVSYSSYTYKLGVWTLSGEDNGLTRNLPTKPIRSVNDVMQTIEIQPDNHNYLFGVYPVYYASNFEFANNVKWDNGRRAMIRDGDRSRQLKYTTVTSGIKDGRLLDIVDVLEQDVPRERELRNFPPELTRVKQAADAVIAAMPQEDQTDTIKRAKALESYLRDSGQFGYTLQAPARDPTMDPIEDFLVNNPVGHCEYFASTLTLMLRSQGIPARMVNGYKGGDWNSLGEFYQVRQLHAHVWVEVKLNNPNAPYGTQWLILDPTPAAADVEMTLWSSLNEFTDYIQHVWSSYVLGMTSDSQSEAIYNELFSAHRWRETIDQIKQFFIGEGTLTGFLNIRMIISLMILPVFIYGLIRLSIGVSRWLRGDTSETGQKRKAAKAQVEFYRRFENILAERRIFRDAAQTQREFAMAIGGHLSTEGATRPLAGIPRFVVDAFYQVRFGAKQLALEDLSKLGRELDRLEAEVPKSNGNGR
ncbi:MAG: DUF3488 and transglutaminase-like domain-containing protein [Pirellulales bacterium]|nr:DUF3488 and transglutaminase-like domain-containing protein [Pirellulales bacterium]